MFKKFAPYLIIIFFSVISCLPQLKPGLYTMHDDQQVARLFLFDKAIKAGQFPVHWVDELGFGYGYPLFIFYPPLVYVLGEFYHLAGFGFIDSTKLVFASSIFFSGVALYVCAKEFYGKMAGLVGTIFYILVPYRALDVYVRGALAESFAFVWPPLIIWSFYKLQKERKRIYLVLSAVFLALLMITHILILIPFLTMLPVYLLFLLLISKDKKITFINFFLAVIFSAAISAFFWLPSLLEKKYTLVDQLLLTNLADYKIHFVYPQQLWNWTWGFGGSAPGLADGISFKIGKIHIIVSIFAFLFSAVFALKSKLFPKSFNFKIYLTLLFFTLFVFSAFMTTFYSKFIWDSFQPLQYLQFPWRFLTFTALFAALLSSAFIKFLRLPILKLIASLALIILVFFPNIKLFQPQFYRPALTDARATSYSHIAWDVSLSSFEYSPAGVEIYKGPLGTNLVKIERSQIPKSKAQIEKGSAKIINLKSAPGKISFSINAQTPAIVQINQFNFPGWKAKVDGQSAAVNDKNNLKLINLNVPQGNHKVVAEFVNTPTVNAANAISVGSVFLLLILYFFKWPILKKP